MGMMNNAAQASEKMSELSELVSSRKEYILKQTINGFLLFTILVIFGCFDFAHLTFHLEYLIDPNYWYNIFMKGIADICAYNIGINVVLDDVIKRNTTLERLKILYEKLNACKDKDFPEFMVVYNRENRVKAYVSKMNHQLYKLNKYSRRSSKVKYNKGIRTGHYCKKRSELEYLMTEEYIKNNYDVLNVRYRDIDAEIFELEINGSRKVVQGKVTGSIGKGRLIATSTTIMGVIAISMFFNSFSLEPDMQEFEDELTAALYYIMRAVTDVAIVCWQFMRGVLTTHSIVSNQLTLPLSERVKILKRYYAWRAEHGKSVPQCYLDTLKEKKDEELVEIDMNDYKAYLESKK